MNIIKRIFGSFLLALTLLTLGVGCKSTLAPDGSYNKTVPDMAFYQADSAFGLAYDTINLAFEAEYNNRALLWSISPEIKHTLDKVRPVALQVRNDYVIARDAYLKNPTPAGLTGVQSILAKAQQLLSAVSLIPELQKYIQPTTTK